MQARYHAMNLAIIFGVYIDSKMQFKTNIKLVEVKIAKAVGILNKLRFFSPKTTLLLFYYALVLF